MKPRSPKLNDRHRVTAFHIFLPLVLGLALVSSSRSYDSAKAIVLGESSSRSAANNIGRELAAFASEERSPVITYEFDDANGVPAPAGSGKNPIATSKYGKNPIVTSKYGKNPIVTSKYGKSPIFTDQYASPMTSGDSQLGKLLIPPPGGMPFKFHFGLDTTIYYDDNIYLSHDRPVSDVIFQIAPHFGLDMGDVDGRVDTYGILRYTPAYNIYLENEGENTLDHDASFEGMFRIQRLAFLGYSRYQRYTDANPNAGERFEEAEFTNALRAIYDVSPKTNLEFGIKNVRTEHSGDPTLVDSTEWIYDVVAEYVVSDKTRLGAGYAYGTLDADRATMEQTFHRPFGRLNWYPSGKVSLDALAGMDFRELSNGDRDTFVYDVNLYYNPSPGTTMQIGVYRDVEPSVFFENQNFTATGVEFIINQRVGNRWTAGLAAGYEWMDFYAVSDTATATRDDEYYFIRPSLTYAFRDWMSLEFWYRHQNHDSPVTNFDYELNQVGATLKVIF